MPGPVTTNFLPSRKLYALHPDESTTFQQLLIAYQIEAAQCFDATDANFQQFQAHTFTGLQHLYPQTDPSVYADLALQLRHERAYTRIVSN